MKNPYFLKIARILSFSLICYITDKQLSGRKLKIFISLDEYMRSMHPHWLK